MKVITEYALTVAKANHLRWMLLIDTCGDPGEVALADLTASASAVLMARRVVPGRQTQESLLPVIADLLAQCDLTSADMHVVAVVAGPGSFTGVRVGLAAAKGLAEALQIPLVTVSRLAVLAAQAGHVGVAEAWISAGRGDIFRGRYRGGMYSDEAMMRAEDALAELGEPGAVIVEEQLLSISPRLRLVTAGVQQALPLAALRASAGDFTDTALADANYLRIPDAELARRARVPQHTLNGA